jgi:DNA-directed RNA polymerase specialized sigma24 family protein
MVELFEIEGMNSAEISGVLGIPRGTVRWTLHEARKALREAMETVQNDY